MSNFDEKQCLNDRFRCAYCREYQLHVEFSKVRVSSVLAYPVTWRSQRSAGPVDAPSDVGEADLLARRDRADGDHLLEVDGEVRVARVVKPRD